MPVAGSPPRLHNDGKGGAVAIVCPRCGAGYDVTLFQFDRRIRCDCGAWVDLQRGHTETALAGQREGFPMAEEEIGRVTHYFSKIGVAAIEITQGSLALGDTIRIKGHTSDFTQTIDSMQIDGKNVQKASAGQGVGLKVQEHAREHDAVYKVTD
jgi:putative protease